MQIKRLLLTGFIAVTLLSGCGRAEKILRLIVRLYQQQQIHIMNKNQKCRQAKRKWIKHRKINPKQSQQEAKNTSIF